MTRLTAILLCSILVTGCTAKDDGSAATAKSGDPLTSTGDASAGDSLRGDDTGLAGDARTLGGDDASAGDGEEGDSSGNGDSPPPGDDLQPGGDEGPGVPLPGFGAITGDCGVLDTSELTAPVPAQARSTIDFGVDPYDPADFEQLSAGGQQVISDGNAGGSSLASVTFAYEVLYRCELAALHKTESEIVYDTATTAKADLLVDIDGLKIGVTVTRAVGYPLTEPYTVSQATDLLQNRLQEILVSSANVSAGDAWEKQILVVMAYAQGHADALEAAYAQLDAATKADTLLMVVVSEGSDDFLH